MRTMMIANTLVTDGNPTAKGAIGLKDAVGNPSNFIASPANTDPNGMFQFINSLGNGSVKTFTINPNNFNFHVQLSGYAAEVAPVQSITYPTGNVRTDSFTNQFEGGIVVKKLDAYKNVYNTTKIVNVEVIGATTGIVTAAEVVTAFKAAMLTLTSTTDMTNPIKSVAHSTGVSSVYTLNDNAWYIQLTGDLRQFIFPKTEGASYINTGADAVLFEKELATNSGYNNTLDKFEGAFANSNFIADSTAVYDIITIVTRATAQRPLLPNAAGFDKQLHIYVPHTAQAAVYDKIVAYLTALKASNGAAVAIGA